MAGHVGDRSLLAGEWEYEDGAILTLRLDEQGNGTYAWKDGHFETQVLNGHRWQGLWVQRENDREGGSPWNSHRTIPKARAVGGIPGLAPTRRPPRKAARFI